MSAYLVQLDLAEISEQLSAWWGCPLSEDDLRDVLEAVGFRESLGGWLTRDVRPLMLACARPGQALFSL